MNRTLRRIVAFIVDYWSIGSLTGLTPEAAEAQAPPRPFSWIFDRSAQNLKNPKPGLWI